MTSRPDLPDEFRDQPGAEDAAEASSEATELARRLLHLATVPANAEVVDAALRLVVALAHATVTGADGVSVSLTRGGTLATVAATDETIMGMDSDQYATGEGPCLSAAIDGHRIYVESLATETRWPEFIPRAKERGINSILSMPLLTGERSLGALNIYSNRAGALSDPEQTLAALCAQEASTLLANAAVDISAEDLSDRLREALEGRQTVTLAIGVVMTREGVSVDDAHTLLLQSSRQSAIPLREQAEAIVASTHRGAPADPAKDAGPHGQAPR